MRPEARSSDADEITFLLGVYRDAKRDEQIARLRRVLAPRAMAATGISQRQIADALGVTQPAVSQQLKFKSGSELDTVHPEVLLEAAAPVLNSLAAEHGYSRLAAFGSVARHEARKHSDIDLLVGPVVDAAAVGQLQRAGELEV